MRIGIKGVQ